MKKQWLIMLLVAILFLTACAYANSIPPPEFQEPWQGEGYSVLIVDDYTGWADYHGHHMFNILYQELPDLQITGVEFNEINHLWSTWDYDVIMVMPWFPSEATCQVNLPYELLHSESLILAPAGNKNPPYFERNNIDKWAVTVGALDHPNWRSGEIMYPEDETYGGTCGATAMAAVDAIRYMHENECGWKEWMEERE